MVDVNPENKTIIIDGKVISYDNTDKNENYYHHIPAQRTDFQVGDEVKLISEEAKWHHKRARIVQVLSNSVKMQALEPMGGYMLTPQHPFYWPISNMIKTKDAPTMEYAFHPKDKRIVTEKEWRQAKADIRLNADRQAKETEYLNTRIGHAEDKYYGLAGRMHDVEKSETHAHDLIEQLFEVVDELADRLATIEKNKMDKPSVAQELIDAEKYVDDYQRLKSKYAQNRHARRQKIKKFIKDMGYESVDEKVKERLNWGSVVFDVLLLTIVFAAICCIGGLLFL